MRRPPLAVLSTALLSVLVVAGCTPESPDPAPTSSQTSSPTASATQDGAVTSEVEHLGAPVQITVHPLQATSDSSLLTVDFAMPEDAPDGTSISLGVLMRDPGSFLNVGQIRLLDLSSSTVFDTARDATDQAVTTSDPLNLTPGSTITAEAYFAAPTSDTVDVLFPYFGLVPGVPVEQVDASDLASTPADLGAEGEITASSATIDAFTVAYDDNSSARVEGETATVTLASDVLFATDQFVLTPEAAAVVDAAGEQIRASGQSGEVTVVGHTDDVGTDAYNQELSIKRAQSVADRLTPALGAGYTVSVEGVGESQPVAPGTSPEARAANRRVEIRFTTKDPGAAVDVPSTIPAPEATGPVASGDDTVSVDVDGVGYDITATSVERHEGYLVGSLEVERTSAGAGPLTGLFGDFATGRSLGRGISPLTLAAGAFNVSLLGEGSRLYPGDYVTAVGSAGSQDRRAVVADRFLDAPVAQGQSVTVTVVWPDLGEDSVDIDVPERFRITDVPVADS